MTGSTCAKPCPGVRSQAHPGGDDRAGGQAHVTMAVLDIRGEGEEERRRRPNYTKHNLIVVLEVDAVEGEG